MHENRIIKNTADFNKFLNGSVSFNNFNNICETDFDKLYRIIDEITKIGFKYHDLKCKTFLFNHFVRSFITAKNLNSLSFDEKMAILILAVDPDLEMYKTYLSFPSSESKYYDEGVHSYIKLVNNVSAKIGMFDKDILKYEAYFFNRFFSDNELMFNVNKPYSLKLIKKYNSGLMDSLSLDRINELLDISNLIYSSKNVNCDNVAFNILYQTNLLSLKNSSEQIAFFILSIVLFFQNKKRIFGIFHHHPSIKHRASS